MRAFSLSLCAALFLSMAGCPQAPPPAPTLAWVQGSRPGVVVSRGGQSQELGRSQRLSDGNEVRTQAGTRASLFLDSGTWVLLDGSSSLRVTEKGLSVLSGRAFIDARSSEEVVVEAGSAPGVKLTAQSASLSVKSTGAGAEIYCAAGQATWRSGTQGGRLEAGLSLLYQGSTAKETAQALWDDWTYGLAEPGPLRPLEPAGVGQLTARSPGALGTARSPLIVRQHDVRVRIDGDLAVTEIEQTFFNPRSEYLEGIYAVRLPESAILQSFAVGTEDESPQFGQLTPSIRPGGGSAFEALGAQLEWAGPGRYRGQVNDIRPGKTKVVRLRYTEWLPHFPQGGATRRTYVYPMGQTSAALVGGAPNLGEFSLDVDVGNAQVSGLAAGLSAKVEGSHIVLRRSDFRPRADFVLELIDQRPQKGGILPAYRGPEVGGARYAYLHPTLAPGLPASSLDLVLVVDVSAATDEARLDLARTTANAVLEQLGPQDKVAVIAASTSAATLGREPMAAASKERLGELSAALAKQAPGGASNLEAALQRAVELLPRGRGSIIYFGDGRPTVGALLPGELKDHLQRLGSLPRFFAVAIGGDANTALLEALTSGGTRPGLLRVEDRPEAARAALYLIERSAQPSLRDVTVSLGEEAEVVYPEAPVIVEGGDALPIVARLRKDRPSGPRIAVISGLRDGQPFSEKLELATRGVEDEGDLARRWALSRLERLLQRGAGREAILDIGTRFAVVTPWTALVIGGRGGDGYRSLVGEGEAGLFVPPALRDLAPTDTPVALEAGVSTTSVRSESLEGLYQRAIKEREAPARVCYERRAAGHPELSGRVTVKIKIGLDGVPKEATVVTSTLRKKEVDTCIERALLALKLPPAPDGKPHEVLYAMQLTQTDNDDGGGRSCSAASRAYLAVRRALWRERLSRNPGVEGAMQVYREAQSRCELRSWLDRRALIDLMRPNVGTTVYQVDLYHRFDGDENGGEIQSYLRREILRAVRTDADVRAAQAGLMLDGGIDPGLVEQELANKKTVAERIAVVRQFLALSPGALALKLRLLGLLEEAGQKDEARRLVESLRGDPGADAAVRQAAGEFLLRSGDGAEGARVFSEIVEFAPFDPWGRRRLGDLYRAHGLSDAAYREYQVLGWLVPQDETVFLHLANAAGDLGRTDEALRLSGRVAEAVGARAAERGPSAWARALYAVQLVRLKLEAQKRGDQNLLGQLAQRGRSDGVAGYAGQLLLAVSWTHPDANFQLYVSPPGAAAGTEKVEKPRGRAARAEAAAAASQLGERATLQAGAIGLEAQRFERIESGAYRLTLRKDGKTSGPVGAELIVLGREGQPGEVMGRLPLKLAADPEIRHFRFVDGKLVDEDQPR